MMKPSAFFLLVTLSVFLYSCEKPGRGHSVETGDVSDVTVVSARLSGKLVSTDLPAGAVYGILIANQKGVRPDNAARILVAACDADGRFYADTVGLSPSEPYYYTAFLEKEGRCFLGSERSFRTENLSEGRVIDMGVDVLWASCNVGATVPQEFGNYYAWGETQPKTEYTWMTYKWAGGADIYANSTHALIPALKPEDDAACQLPGGDLRTPTETEFRDLVDHSISVWVTYKKQTGQVLLSKVTGASIFIPAGGYWEGTTLKKCNELGQCWSATPWGSPYAGEYEFLLPGSGSWLQKVAITERQCGLTIRPVKDK